MLSLEDVLLALAAHGCAPERAGRSAWRAACPRCGKVDALGLNFSIVHGVSVLPTCGCTRAGVLAALGLREAA